MVFDAFTIGGTVVAVILIAVTALAAGCCRKNG